MIDANSPLPPLESPYTLTADQIAAYQRDGHILLPGVASAAEVAAYEPAITRFVKASGKDKIPLEQRDRYNQSFLQVSNIWEFDETVARFALAKRFGRLAAELMGVDAVRIYHDQALYKEPGGGETFWHQDQYYWPLDTENTITMWMPLVDVPVEKGVLTFASGSHTEGLVCQEAISETSHEKLLAELKRRQYAVTRSPMRAGDATFHAGWTLHTAPGNQSDTMRAVMTIIYFADGARIVEPDTEHREVDLQRWLPGQKPGELAASKLNPIVWQRGD